MQIDVFYISDDILHPCEYMKLYKTYRNERQRVKYCAYFQTVLNYLSSDFVIRWRYI